MRELKGLEFKIASIILQYIIRQREQVLETGVESDHPCSSQHRALTGRYNVKDTNAELFERKADM